MKEFFMNVWLPCLCEKKVRKNINLLFRAFIVTTLNCAIYLCFFKDDLMQKCFHPKKYVLPYCNESNLILYDEYLVLKQNYANAIEDRNAIDRIKNYLEVANYENIKSGIEKRITTLRNDSERQFQLQKECVKSHFDSILLKEEWKVKYASGIIIIAVIYSVRTLHELYKPHFYGTNFWNFLAFLLHAYFVLGLCLLMGGGIQIVYLYKLSLAVQNMDEYMQTHDFN